MSRFGGSGGSGGGGSSLVTTKLALYKRNTDVATSSGVPALIDFNTQVYNNLTKLTVTPGASWRATALEDVTVKLIASLYPPAAYAQSVDAGHFVFAYLNGSQDELINRWNPGAAATYNPSLYGGPLAFPLTAGDYLDVRLLQYAGSINFRGVLQIIQLP